MVQWDTATGSRVGQTLDDNDFSAINNIAFSPDGTVLAAGDDAANVTIWDPTTGSNILCHAVALLEWQLEWSRSGPLFRDSRQPHPAAMVPIRAGRTISKDLRHVPVARA